MKNPFQGLIDRYLYPDQIIFGHLFNPNLKISHQFEMTKSTPQQPQNNQLIIYQKTMSSTKINSMLSMMQGNHPPLFKSTQTHHSSHLQPNNDDFASQSYDEEDYYDDYDDQMSQDGMDGMDGEYDGYMNGNEDEYQNYPVMNLLGQSMGAYRQMNNYAQELGIPDQLPIGNKNSNAHLFMSQYAPPQSSQKGLGQILTANKKAKSSLIQQSKKTTSLTTKKPQPKKSQKPEDQKEDDQDWETDSQQESQGQDQNKSNQQQ